MSFKLEFDLMINSEAYEPKAHAIPSLVSWLRIVTMLNAKPGDDIVVQPIILVLNRL
ncbi:MAG: hypothetical protein Q8L51_02125 [Candidatus Amesbacteria bacterium]|nr:hypothetical protein [Candidatus Amesbacteria bacterium]